MDVSKTIEQIQNSTRRRRSIFGDEEVTVTNTEVNYPPTYKHRLENEIEQWNEQLKSVCEEHKNLKDNFNRERKVLVDKEIFSKEEMEFFDHDIYHDYLKCVSTFSKKLTVAVELQKQRDIANDYKKREARALANQVEKQIKAQLQHNKQKKEITDPVT